MNSDSGAPDKARHVEISEDLAKEVARALSAKTIPHDGAMMVYHPLLRHLNVGGFYSDPEDCAGALAIHWPDVWPAYKFYAFATTAEGCQRLNLDDLIQSAAQNMYEGWYQLVSAGCRLEIQIAQSTLDALHQRFRDLFPRWRIDYSRVVALPSPSVDKKPGDAQ